MRFGYRLMRGRQGVSGHARAMGSRAVLSVRGLSPDEPCVLFALRDRGAERLETRKVGRDGTAQFMIGAEESLFAAQGSRVVLWEDGPDAEEQYLRACAWLREEIERKWVQADSLPCRSGEASSPDSPEQTAEPPQTAAKELAAEPTAAETQKLKRKESENLKETALAPENNSGIESARPAHSGDSEDRQATEKQPNQKRTPRRFSLRPAGTGEPVNALPILRWPAGTEDLRLNCALRPPFAPLNAPGWRFVQVPSPLPHVPFCAVGFQARDARVCGIAYAIPGPPNQPPVRLSGYHYQPGSGGQGYWVMCKRV